MSFTSMKRLGVEGIRVTRPNLVAHREHGTLVLLLGNRAVRVVAFVAILARHQLEKASLHTSLN
eukprot:CAMPEP_0119519886 /NCGR_PEP_ID=MMETSP1344-20130328/36051_1 /TAXON_ID=236787 /ORGANISM="Florenciella parvula, Strain CCMP2471" /LENGTH=63 /DNA_ID=CAMNT_0007557711 /DNA_START=34 /DNA_END=222 /DNA_ORIENTATION=+